MKTDHLASVRRNRKERDHLGMGDKRRGTRGDERTVGNYLEERGTVLLGFKWTALANAVRKQGGRGREASQMISNCKSPAGLQRKMESNLEERKSTEGEFSSLEHMYELGAHKWMAIPLAPEN
ncbi:hypothetical protein R1sor_026161 [Riccia sorocarpa]|uniref:Uncharacterized protein n=1 Tax=Riccia sorocarpa TaxID=122646 RepID=A0ABD3GAL8_9MARC